MSLARLVTPPRRPSAFSDDAAEARESTLALGPAEPPPPPPPSEEAAAEPGPCVRACNCSALMRSDTVPDATTAGASRDAEPAAALAGACGRAGKVDCARATRDAGTAGPCVAAGAMVSAAPPRTTGGAKAAAPRGAVALDESGAGLGRAGAAGGAAAAGCERECGAEEGAVTTGAACGTTRAAAS